ncbi:hypothetical protein [Pedobacter chitinilyticus]|uniref:Uncharacterized protein n=1 Tax=Pedobacter chitinilyticus TaxID=2233776 RepID=A0A3S4RR60_9SPHI|nr:hypothetical protein [Pedobacter chitinilyticus]RWU08184.1 hypothetical protein DPV69_07320 [Pedobacter chitinilyticus]
MANKNEQLLYDTLLCIPGMNESVRIDVKVSRKMVLLLSQVVERGLDAKDGTGMMEAMPAESLQELRELVDGFMEKSGLTELARKLNAIQQLKG